MRLAIAAVAMLWSVSVHAQVRCTSPQDTRCSPSYWLAPVYSGTTAYSQNAFLRKAQIYDCTRPRVIPPPGCAAALKAEREATGAYYGR